MKKIYIKCKFKYNEEYLPPRCKYPRYRESIDYCKIFIPCIDESEAPIAFSHKYDGGYTRYYRFYNGKCYIRSTKSRNMEDGYMSFESLKNIIETVNSYNCMYEGVDVETCRKALHKTYSCYLIIENNNELEVWIEIGEPRYQIQTFGLGHNHGSTAIFIENKYNSNIYRKAYYNAFQYEEVKRDAIKLAERRGDTDSIERLKKAKKIEIYRPEFVKMPKNEKGIFAEIR